MTPVRMHKPRGVALGVRFDRLSESVGARVDSVEPYGLAWQFGLGWGDVVTCVKVFSTIREGEILSEHVIASGLDAAKALRPAYGEIEILVQKRKITADDKAAARLQAVKIKPGDLRRGRLLGCPGCCFGQQGGGPSLSVAWSGGSGSAGGSSGGELRQQEQCEQYHS